MLQELLSLGSRLFGPWAFQAVSLESSVPPLVYEESCNYSHLTTQPHKACEVQSTLHLVFLFYKYTTTKYNFGMFLTFPSHMPKCSCSPLPLFLAFISLVSPENAEIVQISRGMRQEDLVRTGACLGFKRNPPHGMDLIPGTF